MLNSKSQENVGSEADTVGRNVSGGGFPPKRILEDGDTVGRNVSGGGFPPKIQEGCFGILTFREKLRQAPLSVDGSHRREGHVANVVRRRESQILEGQPVRQGSECLGFQSCRKDDDYDDVRDERQQSRRRRRIPREPPKQW